MVAYALILFEYAYLLIRSDVSQLILPMGVTATLLLTGVLSTVLNQRYRSSLATWLLIGATLLVAPVTTTAVSSLGVVLGIAGAVAAVQTGSQTLPRQQIPWVIGASLASSIATMLIDQFWPGSRLALSDIGFVVPAVAIALMLTNGFFFTRQYKDFSIRAKLISSTFVMTALAVVAITFFVGNNTSNILVDSIGRDLNRLAESHALAVGELLGQQAALLELLSQSQALQSRLRLANAAYPMDAAGVREQIEASAAIWTTATPSDALVQGVMRDVAALELNRFHDAFPAHLKLFVTDRYGALRASTHRISDFYQADEGWWQAAYDDGAGATYISFPASEPGLGAIALQMAVPIYDASDGDLLGILQTTYSMDDLDELLSSVALGMTGRAVLLLPSGEFYNAYAGSFEEVDPKALPRLEATWAGTFDEFEIDGQVNLVSQAPVNTLGHVPSIDTLGWTIVTHQARAEAVVTDRQQRGTLMLISVVVLAATSSIAAILADKLTGSLARLTQSALRLEAGDLSTQVNVESRDEIGQLAEVFNNITRQLRQTLARLERQVTHRTHALEASVQVSRTLSSILDQEQLVSEVVEQVRSAFGYYHAHIYLLDETNGDLIMAGGTGLAGKTMLDAGHRIPRGRGLVGRAASTKEVVLAPDVKRERDWLANPLLPDTEAEIAVPIAIRDQVLGVLDIQHDVVGGLTEEDTRLLQSVANQVAIALRNARLYELAQQQAERQKLINAINQKIHAANTIEEVLQITVTELGQALGAERASVQLGFSKSAANGKGNPHSKLHAATGNTP
jgi:putative methionine-R-sulfoxide reductase with GAF domain